MPLARDARALVFGYGVEGRSALAWLRRHGVSDVAVCAMESVFVHVIVVPAATVTGLGA